MLEAERQTLSSGLRRRGPVLKESALLLLAVLPLLVPLWLLTRLCVGPARISLRRGCQKLVV
jgi:hypothetical protein